MKSLITILLLLNLLSTPVLAQLSGDPKAAEVPGSASSTRFEAGSTEEGQEPTEHGCCAQNVVDGTILDGPRIEPPSSKPTKKKSQEVVE